MCVKVILCPALLKEYIPVAREKNQAIADNVNTTRILRIFHLK